MIIEKLNLESHCFVYYWAGPYNKGTYYIISYSLELFACWVILHALYECMFSKKNFRNTIRVCNSLDPDQAGCFVRPDLAPNCLQRLSANDTSSTAIK